MTSTFAVVPDAGCVRLECVHVCLRLLCPLLRPLLDIFTRTVLKATLKELQFLPSSRPMHWTALLVVQLAAMAFAKRSFFLTSGGTQLVPFAHPTIMPIYYQHSLDAAAQNVDILYFHLEIYGSLTRSRSETYKLALRRSLDAVRSERVAARVLGVDADHAQPVVECAATAQAGAHRARDRKRLLDRACGCRRGRQIAEPHVALWAALLRSRLARSDPAGVPTRVPALHRLAREVVQANILVISGC